MGNSAAVTWRGAVRASVDRTTGVLIGTVSTEVPIRTTAKLRAAAVPAGYRCGVVKKAVAAVRNRHVVQGAGTALAVNRPPAVIAIG